MYRSDPSTRGTDPARTRLRALPEARLLHVHHADIDGPWLDNAIDAPSPNALLIGRSARCLAWRARLPTTVVLAGAGRLVVRVESIELRLRPGELLMIPAALATTLRQEAAEPSHAACSIALTLPGLDADDASTFTATGAYVFDDPDLAETLGVLALGGEGGRDATHDVVAARIAAVRSRIARRAASLRALALHCPGRSAPARHAMLGRLLRAHHAITASDGSERALAALAMNAGLSRWHFLRVFRALFGETPHALAARRRLATARRLLQHGRQPIAAIARELGFPDTSSFGSFIRRHCGHSPGSLRRAAIDGAQAPRPAARTFPRPASSGSGAHTPWQTTQQEANTR